MNVPVTRAAEGLGRRAFTIADLERMATAGVLDLGCGARQTPSLDASAGGIAALREP